jgi:hypothetical protein
MVGHPLLASRLFGASFAATDASAGAAAFCINPLTISDHP